MKVFNNILVAVDLSCGDRLIHDSLSPHAQEALDMALFVALRSKARVTLQAAMDIESGLPEFTKRTHDIRPALEKDALEALDRCAKPFEEAGLATERVVSFGKPHLEIIRRVLEKEHDLLVCGTRESTFKRYTSLGSTSIKLVRKAPCPVLVAKSAKEKNYRCILACVDLSPVSEKVARLAGEAAEALGADLHLLNVVEFPDLGIIYKLEDAAGKTEEYKNRQREEARSKLKELAEKHTPPAAAKHIVLKEGNPYEAIIETVDHMKPDMVVLATVSRTGIAGILTGNTAEKILGELTSPMLVVKPDGFECPVKL